MSRLSEETESGGEMIKSGTSRLLSGRSCAASLNKGTIASRMMETKLNLPNEPFKFYDLFAILKHKLYQNLRSLTLERPIKIFLLAFALVLFSFSELNFKDYSVNTIVIDAGHGGKDSGTLGSISKEKDIALAIALELGQIIEKYLPGVEVIYTRKDNTFIELSERAELANKNHADLFLSIHCNSAEDSRAHGTETFVIGMHRTDDNLEVAMRENSVIEMEEDFEAAYEGFDPNSPESYILFANYQSANITNSLNLADKIENQFTKRVKRYSRGVKQAGFVVLWKTSMPSVLVETGFLSNRNEEMYLNDEYGRTLIASGIFRAVRDYKEEVENK